MKNQIDQPKIEKIRIFEEHQTFDKNINEKEIIVIARKINEIIEVVNEFKS